MRAHVNSGSPVLRAGLRTALVWTLPAVALAAGVSLVHGAWQRIEDFEMEQSPTVPADSAGYRGIWYSQGPSNDYGPRYSGGLSTYTANMCPMATYSAAAKKTFFVYGGAAEGDDANLQIMCAAYDHTTATVTRPTLVRDSGGFADPHANPAVAVDDEGYVWVFSSTRHTFEGRRYRSRHPCDISGFDLIDSRYMAYAQPWHIGTNGFLFAFTQYVGTGPSRMLYYQTSKDGTDWSEARLLAGFEGHYQSSAIRGRRFGTAFNYHPGADNTRRTDIYYVQTDDMGQTWTDAGGNALAIPLTTAKNAAMVIDYEAQGKLVFIHDVAFDGSGKPAILYITSSDAAAGPAGDPRTWHVTHWNGSAWSTSDITTSKHNYDTGCLHIEEDGTWRVIGPTAPGPQPWGTGGEVEMWVSTNQGLSWTRERILTSGSPRNHSYVRRPVPAHPDFYAFWADGDTATRSEVNLYYCTKSGDVFRLPRAMTNDVAHAVRIP